MAEENLKSQGSRTGVRAHVCEACGKSFVPKAKGKQGEAQRFCNRQCKGVAMRKRITKTCPICGGEFRFRSSGERNNRKRVFCSNHCAAKYRFTLPGRRELFEAAIGPKRGTGHLPGRRNPANSAHMKRIWADPTYRARVMPKYQGKTFLSRGGNGELTEPQKLLAKMTRFPTEYAIRTAPVKGRFPSLPSCYKVDLADPFSMTAIEVDGNTHRLRKWRFLDARKTEILEALGWSVIRFRNEEVMGHPEVVFAQLMAFIATRERTPELQRRFTFD